MSQARLPDGSVAVVLGTRPEIIKLGELVRLLGPAARVVYTGQHYDDRLGPRFFTELGLPAPDVVLSVGGTPRAQQIGGAVVSLDRHFAEHPPRAVVVQGDTNATVAGALAANARDVPLVHVEAGLRSRDRAMPEEHNRVVVDHLADLCCAPTETARENLAREGIVGDRVVVTGNTVVEALHRIVPDLAHRRALVADAGLTPGRFVLATFHRPENVDDPERLATVLRELGGLDLPVLLPLHPRAAARVAGFGLSALLDRLQVAMPMSYGDFLGLAAESAFLVSDSGGVQEECSVLKRPVAVVRNSTERPEVLGTFARLVPLGPAVGQVAAEWTADLAATHERLRDLASPYGDGTASRRCLDALTDLLERR
ncbi:MAG: UDP-N-acetylglucosamine 2-epimerase (non-hydrolyzing) [Nocardioidaceae bacterium]